MSRPYPGGKMPSAGTIIPSQSGLVTEWNGSSDISYVYSPTCGTSIVPATKVGNYGHTFNYTALKLPKYDGHTAPPLDVGAIIKYDSVLGEDGNWVAINIDHSDDALEMSARQTFEVKAIVCATHPQSFAAEMWLWNDIIGRIYVPDHSFCQTEPFAAVRCEVTHTRSDCWQKGGEDVPWTASNIEVLDVRETAETLKEIGASLKKTVSKFKLSVEPSPHGLGILSDGHMDIYVGWNDITGHLMEFDENGEPLLLRDEERFGVTYVDQIGFGNDFKRAVFVSQVEHSEYNSGDSESDDAELPKIAQLNM